MRTLHTQILLIAALTASASAVRAQAQEGDPAAPAPLPAAPATGNPTTLAAREAILEGQAFARQERWSEALAAFQRSAGLRPHPLTTFNIGFCERALGRATRARKAFLGALEERDASGAVLSGARREQAERYIQELENRVAKVRLVIGTPLDSLTVDGRPLEEERRAGQALYVAGTAEANARAFAPTGASELLIDPGNHLIVGARAGRPDIVSSITFERDSPGVLEIHAPAEASAPLAVASKEPVRPTPPLPASRIWAYTALGVGAAGLLSGAAFGVVALSKQSALDSNPGCKPVGDHVECDPSLSNEIDSMNFWSDASTVAFIVGGVGAITGAGLWIFGAKTSHERTVSAIRPWLGVGSAGVRGSF